MALFKTQNPFYNSRKSLPFLSIFVKTLKSSASQTNQNKHKKSLVVLFQESVGLCEKSENGSESESESDTNEMNKGLKELEKEIRELKAKSNKNEEIRDSKLKPGKNENFRVNVKSNERRNLKTVETKNSKTEETKNVNRLSSLFLDYRVQDEEKKQVRRREEEPKVFKELSSDMELFVSHLCKEGYFDKANFLTSDYKELDFSLFHNGYARDFVKFAAEKFGKDHQEIAKWLSGRDLKTVALFGCPSDTKKTVFSAKRLRRFFEIQEDTVCSECVLKDSCKFVNQSVWKGEDDKILSLAVVMRVIPLYALEAVHPQLVVPDEVKAAVSRLLKEIISLSTPPSTC